MSKNVLIFCGAPSKPDHSKRSQNGFFSRAKTSFFEDTTLASFCSTPDSSRRRVREEHSFSEPGSLSDEEEGRETTQSLSRPCPMVNSGESSVMCFANSVLQCLFSSEGLCPSVNVSSLSLLESTIAFLFRNEQIRKCLSFFEAFQVFGDLCGEFKNTEQQKDASEFLLELIKHSPKFSW